MDVLVVNCGSSSLKLDVLDAESGVRRGSERVERLDGGHADALREACARLPLATVGAVGHRVVHGGARFTEPTPIDDEVCAAIEALVPLAPLHNPANLAGIRAAREALPDLPHVAVFDTAFHATLPRRARHYALPADVAERHGLRRYGFHGPSHAWLARRAAEWLGAEPETLRLVTCHLGNGCSVSAVEYGRSVETSMGMTPLEGLVMGTRAGDVDPGVLLTLLRREGLDVDGLDALLNRRSGLAGLSGVGNDLRDIEAKAAHGDEPCRTALQVFAHRARKYIGAYAAVMGGVDAIVFAGGIGENSAPMRHRIGQRLEFLGARLDEDRNRDAAVDHEEPVFAISDARSRCRLLVVKTDEAHAIARAAAKVARAAEPHDAGAIPIAVSARHIHLTRAAVDTLFGAGHTLTPHKPLSQPGQFACTERLSIVGPRRSIEGVRVLGPVRARCQVEISRTDEFFLGVDAPVRNSGDVLGTPGVTLVGPAGSLTLEEGLICARRHIHLHPDDAQRFGVRAGDIVEVAVDSEGRDLVFGDVLIRVKSSYRTEMHIDTDEANAAELRPGHEGALVGTGATAHLRHRRAPRV